MARTFIFPSKQVVIQKEKQAIQTFSSPEIRTHISQGQMLPTDPSQKKTFQTTHEHNRVQHLLEENRRIAIAQKRLAKLKESIAKSELSYRESETKNLETLAAAAEAAKEMKDAALLEIAEEKKVIIEAAEKESARLLAEAQDKGQKLLDTLVQERETLEKQIHEKAYSEGVNKGMAAGSEETHRLQALIKKVLTESLEEKSRLIEKNENHIMEICLLMVQKIVKTLSQTDKGMVIRNIQAALSRAHGLQRINIHVHPLAATLSKKSKSKFMKIAQGIDEISIVEDPAVEPGGCLITSDLGEVDARLSTQLLELEHAVRNATPIVPRP